MDNYAKLVDGKPVFFKAPLVTDKYHIYNPTPEQLLECGYKSYSAEDVDKTKYNSYDIGIEYQESETDIKKVFVYTPNMERAKQSKLSEINRACDDILSSAVSTYPETEVLTFDQQTSEATTYLQTKNPEDAPLLVSLASGRGITLDDLVQRVVAKHTSFSILSGYIIGQRQALEDRLDTCEIIEDVEEIVVDIKLPDENKSAEAEAESTVDQ
jgi:hypothetical protein